MAHILIVEDEPRIASFVAKGLRADGYLTTVAGDGHEGLEQALSGGFDLVVLDVMLPGFDGLEVCRTSTASRCWTGCARRAPVCR